jgi:hypothetical protein
MSRGTLILLAIVAAAIWAMVYGFHRLGDHLERERAVQGYFECIQDGRISFRYPASGTVPGVRNWYQNYRAESWSLGSKSYLPRPGEMCAAYWVKP